MLGTKIKLLVYKIATVMLKLGVSSALLVLLAVACLLYTEWLPKRLLSMVENRSDVIISGVSGHLAHRLTVDRIETQNWELSGISVGVDVRCLLSGKLCLTQLKAVTFEGILPASERTAASDRTHVIQLPSLQAPLPITIEEVELNRVVVRLAREEREQGIVLRQTVLNKLAWANDAWQLGMLRSEHVGSLVTGQQGYWSVTAIQAHGAGRFHEAWPLTITLRGGLNLVQDKTKTPYSLDVMVNGGGSLVDLALDFELKGDVSGVGDVQLNALDFSTPMSLSASLSSDLSHYSFVKDSPEFRLEEGMAELSWHGTMDEYELQVVASAGNYDAAPIELMFSGKGDRAKMLLEDIQLSTPHGSVSGLMQLQWSTVLASSFNLKFRELTTTNMQWPKALHQLEGLDDVDAWLVGYAELDSEGWETQLSVNHFSGVWREETLRLSGLFDLAHDRLPTVEQVRFQWGDQLSLQGSVKEAWSLSGQLNTASDSNLLKLFPAFEGQFDRSTLSFDLTGAIENPMVAVTGEVNQLSYQQRRIAEKMTFSTKGFLSDLQTEVKLTGGEIDAQWIFTAKQEAAGISGRLSKAEILWQDQVWQLEAPGTWRYESGAKSFSFDRSCWRYLKSRTCLLPATLTSEEVGLEMIATGIPAAWGYLWLPENIDLNGLLDFEFSLAWLRGNSTDVSVMVSSRDLALAWVEQASVDTRQIQVETSDDEKVISSKRAWSNKQRGVARQIALTEFVLTANLLEQSQLKLEVRGGDDAGAKFGGAFELDLAQSWINRGELSVDSVDLAMLRDWLPVDFDLAGRATAQLKLSGALSDPTINAKFFAQDLAAQIASSGVLIEQGSLLGEFDNQQLQLTLDALLNQGQLKTQATLTWDASNQLLADVALTGQDIQYSNGQGIELVLAPDLSLRYRQQDKEMNLHGDLRVSEGKVSIAKQSLNRIPLSTDVIDLDEVQSSTERNQLTLPKLMMQVRVIMGDAVEVSAYGATGKVLGEVDVSRNQRGVLQGHGALELTDGVYKAYGQELIIRNGQITFAGPLLYPVVDISAVREIPLYNVVAGLQLQGSASAPVTSLFSESLDQFDDLSLQPNSDREILSYIVLGRIPSRETDDVNEIDEQQVLTQAALSFGLSRSGVAKKAESVLGVKNMSLETTGTGEEAQFVVGGELSERLYLEYSVGLFAPVNSVVLRYQLGKRLYLEALNGLESALDFYYSIDF